MRDISITVIAELDNETERTTIHIGYPKGDVLGIKQSVHLLAGGISLLVKSCSKHDLGIKDHELMDEIMEHLNKEFSSIDSFQDATIKINDYE